MKPVQVYDGDGVRTDVPHIELRCNVFQYSIASENNLQRISMRFLKRVPELFEATLNEWKNFEIACGQRMSLLVVAQDLQGDTRSRRDWVGTLVESNINVVNGKDQIDITLDTRS